MKQSWCNLVASSQRIAVRGSGSKNALLGYDPVTVDEIDMRAHSGIVTYDPSEFLITAKAGTTINELIAALNENGQYFPFDPVLASSGATLGGTIASGVSGPNRLLYGSLRDFVMEIEMIDGLGKLVRGGGKVVKNAAGFDTPKLMVGSYGRLGVLLEATLKIFPQPAAYVTTKFEFASSAASHSSLTEPLRAMQTLQANPLPISAIEIERPGATAAAAQLIVRFAGRPEALPIVVRRAEQLLRTTAVVTEDSEAERRYWRGLSEFKFATQPAKLIRVAMSGRKLVALDAALQATQGLHAVRYSGGATVAWLAVDPLADLAPLDQLLSELKLPAVVIRQPEPAGCLQLIGDQTWVALSERIQHAMDPHGKFALYSNQPANSNSSVATAHAT